VLEASFIVFRLQPHHHNFNKRLVKMSKLYFVDTGLASHLLGIRTLEEMCWSPFRGALFENQIVTELRKMRIHQGVTGGLYFWRDHKGLEVDLISASVPGREDVPVHTSFALGLDSTIQDALPRKQSC